MGSSPSPFIYSSLKSDFAVTSMIKVNVFLSNVRNTEVSVVVFKEMPQQVSPSLINLRHLVAFCQVTS